MLSHDLYLQATRDGVVNRRSFLRHVAAGSAGVSALNWIAEARVQADELRKQGLSCILIFLNGGPSQFETFDPKPGTETGGPTQAIDTAVPGIRIAEHWPQTAKALQDIAIIRSMTSKEGNHERAQFLLHTGFVPSPAIKYPSLGSVAAHELADPQFDLPHFVNIGGAGPGALGGPFGAGFLPTVCSPFVVVDPSRMPTHTELLAGVDGARLKRRLALMDELEQELGQTDAKPLVEANRSVIGSAARLVTSPRLKAFDLHQEKDSLRDRYGRTPFGQSCLLARRLVETGVTFIEITNSAEDSGVVAWDTHRDNFDGCKTLSAITDPAWTTLIADLKDRGLLEKTLVILMGEFGRTPKINGRVGRDHYPRAYSLAMAGGGIKGGAVLGSTDKEGYAVEDRPITVPDLFCTFCRALKIDPRKQNLSNAGRPLKIVDGGEAIDELFS